MSSDIPKSRSRIRSRRMQSRRPIMVAEQAAYTCVGRRAERRMPTTAAWQRKFLALVPIGFAEEVDGEIMMIGIDLRTTKDGRLHRFTAITHPALALFNDRQGDAYIRLSADRVEDRARRIMAAAGSPPLYTRPAIAGAE